MARKRTLAANSVQWTLRSTCCAHATLSMSMLHRTSKSTHAICYLPASTCRQAASLYRTRRVLAVLLNLFPKLHSAGPHPPHKLPRRRALCPFMSHSSAHTSAASLQLQCRSSWSLSWHCLWLCMYIGACCATCLAWSENTSSWCIPTPSTNASTADVCAAHATFPGARHSDQHGA